MKKDNCIFCKIANGEILCDLPRETASKVLVLAQEMASTMMEKLHCDGLNLVQNNGEAAGQTVTHFHLHMIPRYRDDGQSINWTPGKPTQEALEEIRRQIVE